jgi:glycerate 2-kinase
MIPRDVCERAFAEAVRACDPARLVRERLAGQTFDVGLAFGKAALAMARGAGPVARGLVVAPVLDGGPLPVGWSARDAAPPEPDERSLAAGEAAIELVRSADKGDRVLALISGGASSLVEKPVAGLTLDELRARVKAKMASGAPIEEINALRKQLSAIKGGALAMLCAAPITTLIASDVFDDDPRVVGSGPTVADRPGERVEIVAPMDLFADAFARVLTERGMTLSWIGLSRGYVDLVADYELGDEKGPTLMWGEPTVQLPEDHGVGGRAQQLALLLAKHLRGSDRSAFIAGSDGVDGPAPPDRAAPAGAYVDGSTWDAIVAAGIDPQRSVDRCDAGPALHAVGALFVPGPTGINHADIALVG